MAAPGELPVKVRPVAENSLHASSGICRDDVARLDRALLGMTYPVDKWQLIDHAQRDPVGQGQANQRAIGMLWTLPTGRYVTFAQVLTSAARTARGHPRRKEPAPIID
jgi:hypothetical protein